MPLGAGKNKSKNKTPFFMSPKANLLAECHLGVSLVVCVLTGPKVLILMFNPA